MIRVKRTEKVLLGNVHKEIATDQETDFIIQKISQARHIAEKYLEAETKQENDMFAIMERAMELHERYMSGNEIKTPLEQALKREKIRITKNTTNTFIPLMKLLAPRLPSSTRGRSASILTYATENGVRAELIGNFVRDGGGIVKSAKAASASKQPQRDQRKAERTDAKMLTLRQCAKPFTSSVLLEGLDEGLWTCLVEKQNGRLHLLSVKRGRLDSDFSPLPGDEFLDFS